MARGEVASRSGTAGGSFGKVGSCDLMQRTEGLLQGKHIRTAGASWTRKGRPKEKRGATESTGTLDGGRPAWTGSGREWRWTWTDARLNLHYATFLLSLSRGIKKLETREGVVFAGRPVSNTA